MVHPAVQRLVITHTRANYHAQYYVLTVHAVPVALHTAITHVENLESYHEYGAFEFCKQHASTSDAREFAWAARTPCSVLVSFRRRKRPYLTVDVAVALLS